MFIYLSLDLLIFGLWLLKIWYIKNINIENISMLIIFFALFLLSGLRGNITTDYSNYIILYNLSESISFENIYELNFNSYPEQGYILLEKITHMIFQDYLGIFLVTSLIIVAFNIQHIKKYSKDPILATMLFLEIGNYYISYNLVRQIIAVSIIMFGSKYLYERHFYKFLAFVVVASFFHKSAFIMIPMYFVLTSKLLHQYTLLNILAILLMIPCITNIVTFIQNYYWGWYGTDGYGMQGYSINNVVLPLFIGIMTLALKYFVQPSKSIAQMEKEGIWLNATFIYLFFVMSGLQIMMLSRFISFFSLYVILLLSNEIYRAKNRLLLSLGIYILLISYGIITKLSLPYIFFWE